MFFIKNTWHMRGFVPLVLVLNIIITVLFRIAGNAVITYLRKKHGMLISKVLLVGYTEEAGRIKQLSDEGRLKGLRVVRHITSPESPKEAVAILETELVENDICTVMLMDKELDLETIMAAVQVCVNNNKSMKVLFPHFVTLYNPFSTGDNIGGIPIVNFACLSMTANTDCRFRKLLARLLALSAIIAVSPLLFLIILSIRFGSKGHAIFKQMRFGVNGHPFEMYKFRTMYLGAEQKKCELQGYNESDGALFKMKNDPRVTKVGRFLRKASLDELPQLFNILRGEMRIIGPRPLPVPDLQPYAGSWVFMRHLSYPGLSCVWQVVGRSDIRFEEMCLLDIWYVLNRSWMLDIQITFRTVWVVLFCRGAY